MSDQHGLRRLDSWLKTGCRFEVYWCVMGLIAVLLAAVGFGLTFSHPDHAATRGAAVVGIVCLGNLGITTWNLRRIRARRATAQPTAPENAPSPRPERTL